MNNLLKRFHHQRQTELNWLYVNTIEVDKARVCKEKKEKRNVFFKTCCRPIRNSENLLNTSEIICKYTWFNIKKSLGNISSQNIYQRLNHTLHQWFSTSRFNFQFYVPSFNFVQIFFNVKWIWRILQPKYISFILASALLSLYQTVTVHVL